MSRGRSLGRLAGLVGPLVGLVGCADDPAPPAEIPEAVQRAFENSCTVEGCHDAVTRAAGLSLDAADSPHVVGGASTQSPLPLVTVGQLDRSYMAVKLLPDDQLPAGTERFEERMPRDGIEAEDVEAVNTILAWIAGFGPSGPDDGSSTADGEGTAGTGTGSGDGTSTGTTGDSTTDPGPTTNTGGGPTSPACSVEEVTEGVVVDPLDKGSGAGQIPLSVGVVLEERCGCHTLADRTLNTKFPALLAPAGTLLLDHGDLSSPLGGSTLGAVMESEIFTVMSMPPGSCPAIPTDDRTLLQQWFDAGMPDGATFMP
ncbi:hypothetical protein [Paraliomyxa miuraensis]|uniref:hypothetical protein n=1 Tax=Paraliomyxa miuraensis TaxID=376150 RepID=UPI00225B8FAC|nr:hypothetical protein [Paraliomyxa miuraensis]MCX4246507.1 hypothetical protein [Paraliomyxa miuraensis]